MDITLYHSPGACSMATYISLCEAQADFTVNMISLKKGEQSNHDYAALNPKKKVPFIVVDGKGLSENLAIQYWIAETFTDANLLPANSWDQKKAMSYMGWFASGCHPHITRHFKPVKFSSHEECHSDLKAIAKAMYMEQIELIEQELTGRTWFFDHYTVCDSYFFWIYDRALHEGFDLSAFEYCTAHHNRMLNRQSVQKVLAHTSG